MRCNAVFLDRDGTITKDVNYCSYLQHLELMPTAGEAIRLLNKSQFKVVVITDQSGIGRNYFAEEMLGRIHQKMVRESANYGAYIDVIYYCPHHPEENCECRKSKPKLAYQAIKGLNLEPWQSYVVSDRLMDIQLARAIPCKALMIENQRGMSELDECKNFRQDYTACDLVSAAEWIIKDSQGISKGAEYDNISNPG